MIVYEVWDTYADYKDLDFDTRLEAERRIDRLNRSTRDAYGRDVPGIDRGDLEIRVVEY